MIQRNHNFHQNISKMFWKYFQRNGNEWTLICTSAQRDVENLFPEESWNGLLKAGSTFSRGLLTILVVTYLGLNVLSETPKYLWVQTGWFEKSALEVLNEKNLTYKVLGTPAPTNTVKTVCRSQNVYKKINRWAIERKVKKDCGVEWFSWINLGCPW